MTAQRRSQVHSQLSLRLVMPDGAALPVTATLRYETTDPFAVHVTFHAGGPGNDCAVVWTFARQLLVDGLDAPAGIGDVRVWPVTPSRREVVALALCSPSGEALFEIPRPALSEFLVRTYAEVPVGYEDRHVDIDAELSLLLRDCV